MASKGREFKKNESKERSRIIIEKAIGSKFIRTRYESNGHDCWGNSESSEYKYVLVNGEQQDVFDGWYIIHDDEVALDIGIISLLPEKIQRYLDSGLEEKLKEDRYNRYLILKKEFDKDTIYIRDQKISKIVD